MASSPSASPTRWTPSLPTSFTSLLNPFAPRDDAPAPPADGAGASSAAPQPFSVTQYARRALIPTTLFKAPGPPSAPQSPNASVMFAEPDARSRTNSDSDSREDVTRKARKTQRSKTCYSVCHAPPASTARHKLHRRPRALLQLHLLTVNARPLPAYEVIPSANFSVRLTRTMARLFQARHALCPNDLVVLRAEKYSADHADAEEEDRDVLGLICFGRRDDDKANGGKARIYLASGREWDAYPTANGAYEFFAPDDHGLGLTVRWVPKRNKEGGRAVGKDGSRLFNFSTISPNSRRHPVIASLSKTGLDINDTHRMPSVAAVTPLSSPRHGTFLADAMDREDATQLVECETDAQLREVITTTAIWVTCKEGWCANVKVDDREREAASLASPTKSFPSPMSTPPGSPALTALDKRGSIRSKSSSIIRRTSVMGRPQRASAAFASETTDPSATSTSPARSASVGHASHTGRSRADSTSTVLVHQAASNRRRSTAAKQAAALRQSGHLIPTDLLQEMSLAGEADDKHPSNLPGTSSRRPSTLRSASALSTTDRASVGMSDLPASTRHTLHDRHRSASFLKETQIDHDHDPESEEDDETDSSEDEDEPDDHPTSIPSNRASMPPPATTAPSASLAPPPPDPSHKRHSFTLSRFRSKSKLTDDDVPKRSSHTSPRPGWKALLCGRGLSGGKHLAK